MGLNGYQGQLRAMDQPNGYFPANQELFTLIQNDASSVITIDCIKRIGIQTSPVIINEQNTLVTKNAVVLLNNKEIQIGSTGLYETDEVEITSIKFKYNSSKDTIIDYIITKV